jgi:two-component system chemotaxis response regulator CheY
MRNMLSDILVRSGYNIVGEAVNGNEAYDKYKTLQPDIVAMDIAMPECNGIQAVYRIKKDFPNAKIVMCSAMGQQEMVVSAIKAGACDFIVKPFIDSRVIEAINNALRNK